MSIYAGTTKLTKFFNGNTPLFFATNSDNKLIYPNAAFLDYSGPSGSGAYVESGDCTQWALHSARNLVDNDGTYYLYPTVLDGFKSLGYTETGSVDGIVRYRTDIRNALNSTATIGIGWAIYNGSVFQSQQVQNVTINNNWQTFDISFIVTLYAGQVYAPVLKVGSTSIYERYSTVTFTVV